MAASCLILIVAGSAQAAPATFFGQDASLWNFFQDPIPTKSQPFSDAARNSFLATLAAYGTDDLESYPPAPPSGPEPSPPTLNFGNGLTATMNSGSVNNLNFLSVSGDQFYLAGNQSPQNIPTAFTFNAPITAFGAYFVNYGDYSSDTYSGSNGVSLLLENIGLGTSKLVHIGDFGPELATDDVLYFGVTDSDPFDRVTLVESFDFDRILLDDITAGQALPEPSTLVLLSGLAAGMLIARFRQGMQRRSGFPA